MDKDSLIQRIAQLNDLHDEYFKNFLEHFPLFHRDQSVFGSSALINKAIELQTSAASLGSATLDRLNYIGFSKLVPFDNPVDWYNWKLYVTENNISHTIYASIAVRISSELQRMKNFAELNSWSEYSQLSTSEFLVSYTRYDNFKESAIEKPDAIQRPQSTIQQPITLHINNVIPQHDSEAIDSIDHWDNKLSFISKIIDIISKFL